MCDSETIAAGHILERNCNRGGDGDETIRKWERRENFDGGGTCRKIRGGRGIIDD